MPYKLSPTIQSLRAQLLSLSIMLFRLAPVVLHINNLLLFIAVSSILWRICLIDIISSYNVW